MWTNLKLLTYKKTKSGSLKYELLLMNRILNIFLQTVRRKQNNQRSSKKIATLRILVGTKDGERVHSRSFVFSGKIGNQSFMLIFFRDRGERKETRSQWVSNKWIWLFLMSERDIQLERKLNYYYFLKFLILFSTNYGLRVYLFYELKGTLNFTEKRVPSESLDSCKPHQRKTKWEKQNFL